MTSNQSNCAFPTEITIIKEEETDTILINEFEQLFTSPNSNNLLPTIRQENAKAAIIHKRLVASDKLAVSGDKYLRNSCINPCHVCHQQNAASMLPQFTCHAIWCCNECVTSKKQSLEKCPVCKKQGSKNYKGYALIVKLLVSLFIVQEKYKKLAKKYEPSIFTTKKKTQDLLQARFMDTTLPVHLDLSAQISTRIRYILLSEKGTDVHLDIRKNQFNSEYYSTVLAKYGDAKCTENFQLCIKLINFDASSI